MIYLNFLIDYIISILTPYNSYLIVTNIKQNKYSDIIIISLIIDLIFYHLPYNTIILTTIYLLSKKININSRYNLIINIISFIIYYNVSFFIFNYDITSYQTTFIIGLITISLYTLITNKNI